MRLKHKWSAEKARNVINMHALRKTYEWNKGVPVRKRKSSINKKVGASEKKVHKDYHIKKMCPAIGCLSVTVKLSVHLKGVHKMAVGDEYSALLKSARPYVPLTKNMRSKIKERLQREENRRVAREDENDALPENSEEESGNVSSEEKVDDLNEASTEVNIVMSKFLHHLLSPDGGKRQRKSALQTVREVRTMAFVLDNKVENLLDRFKVRDDFLRDYLEKKRKPGTSKHYISSLISFMDFAISDELKLPGCISDDYISMKLRLYNW